MDYAQDTQNSIIQQQAPYWENSQIFIFVHLCYTILVLKIARFIKIKQTKARANKVAISKISMFNLL